MVFALVERGVLEGRRCKFAATLQERRLGYRDMNTMSVQ